VASGDAQVGEGKCTTLGHLLLAPAVGQFPPLSHQPQGFPGLAAGIKLESALPDSRPESVVVAGCDNLLCWLAPGSASGRIGFWVTPRSVSVAKVARCDLEPPCSANSPLSLLRPPALRPVRCDE
jgi:hypothetical protein